MASASTTSKLSATTATALIAQIQAENPIAKYVDCCRGCYKASILFPSGLKRCKGCKIISYCSQDCQRKDWNKHKYFCQLVQGKRPTNAFFADRPEIVVFALLRDAYRLRVQSDYEKSGLKRGPYYDGSELPIGLVYAKGDANVDFENFLDLAEKTDVLPDWWNAHKRKECEDFATREGNESNIYEAVEFDTLGEFYMDPSIDTALLIVAEKVYGFNGEGPPADDEPLRRFAETLENNQKAKAAIQEEGLARLGSRVAKEKSENPDQHSIGDLLSQARPGLTDQGKAMFDQMIQTFDPHNGNAANFEALRKLGEKMAPNNKEVTDSFQEIAAGYPSFTQASS